MPYCRQIMANGMTMAASRPAEADAAALFSEIGEFQQVPAPRAKTSLVDRLLRVGYSENEVYVLVVPKRTLARRRAGGEPLTIEETDKAMRLGRIAALADRVFGDHEKAHRWLRKPKRQLAGETPVAFLASESGARVVEEMLHRIDHGMAA